MKIELDLEVMKEIGVDSNVRAVLSGDLLILVIDTTKDLGPSSTGKMNTVGNTSGFQLFPGSMKGNVYIGRKVIDQPISTCTDDAPNLKEGVR